MSLSLKNCFARMAETRPTSFGCFRHSTVLLWSVLLVLATFPAPAVSFFGEWGPDLEGPWCATRARGSDCCTGRDDYCAVPILGTECYCDIFCNDTAYDCCPDYWAHCYGFVRPTTTPRPTTFLPPRTTRLPIAPCVRDGRTYGAGDVIRENCNECVCELYGSGGVRRYDWRCTNNVCLMRPEMINAVNDGPYTWRATNYSKFWGKTLDQGVRYRLGTFLLPDNVLQMTPLRVFDQVLPEEFDARQKWPNMLHPIRDQGDCASSWAHSTTAVASDRLTIESEGGIQDELSAQHLLSCNDDGQLGCEGGHLDRAWWFLRKHGVVTEQCYPYRSGVTENTEQCLISIRQRGGACPSGIQYKTDKRYKATPPYRIRPLEREIMKEIMDNGPVQATLLVREDFFMYERGVYRYTNLTGKRLEPERNMKSGFHSVRILGWGRERTLEGDIIKYWICANSWGRDWGESGYFRILRGSDESRVERYVVGVWGKITGDAVLRQLLEENRRKRLRQRGEGRQLRHLQTRRERRRERRRLREGTPRRVKRRNRHRNHRHRKNKGTKKSRRRRTRRRQMDLYIQGL